MKKGAITSLSALLLLAVTAAKAQHDIPDFGLVKKVELAGDSRVGNLTFDADKKRLFIAHPGNVQVLDLNTGKQSDVIDSVQNPAAIALVGRIHKGYITNSTSDKITVFEYFSCRVMRTVPVSAKQPGSVVFDDYSNKLFVFGKAGNNISVIDVLTDKESAVINLEGVPSAAVSDGRGLIYVTLENNSEIQVVDTRLKKVVNCFPLEAGVTPTAIAVDEDNNRLFVACRDSKKLMVLNTVNGIQVAEMEIGGGASGIVFDKKVKLVTTVNSDGTATVIQQLNANEYKLFQVITTQQGLNTIALRDASHKLYISGTETGNKTTKTGYFGIYEYGFDSFAY